MNAPTHATTPSAAPSAVERTRNRKVYAPPVDIFETGDAIVLTADMPVVDEKNVEVTLEKNVLSLRGNVETGAYAGRSIAYAEYDMGDFERSFTVSDEVDRDRIEAVMKNGVLRITLHKTERVKIRKIDIKTE